MANEDPYLWLEEVTGEDALAWVRERNEEAFAELAQGTRFSRMQSEIKEILDADDRIPYVQPHGDYLYNLWKDAKHPRGLWRRTTLAEYRKAQPDWDVLLDLDALAEAEDENWVWGYAKVLPPEYRRALVGLSRGGADAKVVREFDLDRREFVADGFVIPEGKTRVSWLDENTLLIGADFGAGSMTDSGYPRIVKEWRRGTPIDEAVVIYEGGQSDIAVTGYHDHTPGYERDFIRRATDFYRGQWFWRLPGGEFAQLATPEDADVSAHGEWLAIQLRSPWSVDDVTYPVGALLVAKFDDFVRGDRTLIQVFQPDAHTALQDLDWTRNHIVLNTMVDVRTKLLLLSHTENGWQQRALPDVPQHGAAQVIATSPDDNDEYFVNSQSYLQPPTLHYGQIDTSSERLKQAPAFFDPANMSEEQYFATSLDGTKIPYTVVRSSETLAAPTLLTGYGGFEVSWVPAYRGVLGRAWLARGGSFVEANIRGGGEYGPQWHSQAVKENRHLVHEDFVAVAKDLVERGITTPDQLGIQGGSNGGLLMGVMLTQFPELFGAIVIKVPLLDMRRYHTLLAGASWMAEYGDPDDPAEWAFISEYSPYQNVHSGRNYPPTLITTSTRDDRVHPAHARKMMARMREQGHNVRYYENIEGGHVGAADNEQLAFKEALVYEFLWRQLADQHAG